MTEIGMVGRASAPWLGRTLLLGAAMLCIVAGSQWGMLVLAGVYLREGRIESMTSPEAIAGIMAIALAILVVRVRVIGPARPMPDTTLRWLLSFLIVASIGELLRPDLRLGNVTTFISIGAYYLVGTAIGHDMIRRGPAVPLLPALLGIYTAWYLAMLVFFVRGDLGFYGVLPGAQTARLEFRDGFTATELPIYIGFQVPVLVYAIVASRSVAIRFWAALLAACAIALVLATQSFAAMGAIALVLLIFLTANRQPNVRSLSRAALVLAVAGVLAIAATSENIVESVVGKVEDFVAGEGVRALIYAELVKDIVEYPLGIGKGRFVETNSFSWLGQGVYPHSNLLGIGAELGLPALLLFVGFVAVAIVRLAKAALIGSGSLPPGLRMLATTVLAILVYQQFRGLFQDTWVIRETYFWLGVGLGALNAHAGSSSNVHVAAVDR